MTDVELRDELGGPPKRVPSSIPPLADGGRRRRSRRLARWVRAGCGRTQAAARRRHFRPERELRLDALFRARRRGGTPYPRTASGPRHQHRRHGGRPATGAAARAPRDRGHVDRLPSRRLGPAGAVRRAARGDAGQPRRIVRHAVRTGAGDLPGAVAAAPARRGVRRRRWLPVPLRLRGRRGPVRFAGRHARRATLRDEQKQWLESLLQRDGPRLRHRVVFSHLPLWPFAEGRETDYLGDEELERILQKHRVDVHLSGHHHAYYPAAKDGVRFVSQACLGAAPRRCLEARLAPNGPITVIEFPPDGAISVEAYRAPDYVEKIERHRCRSGSSPHACHPGAGRSRSAGTPRSPVKPPHAFPPRASSN